MWNHYRLLYPNLPVDYAIPPTIKSLLDSYVNYGKTKKVKIADLPENGRDLFFDFNYPLDSSMTKKEFEIMILKHFLMRRIGYETVNAFKIALEVKLNEIMPTYNKLFSAYKNWNIFEDGEKSERVVSNKIDTTMKSKTSDETISDRRYSDTPQNNLDDIKNGSYISDYNFDKNNNTSSNDTSSNTDDNLTEKITKSPADKMKLYIDYLNNKQNIMTMIFKDLDSLFYQVV